MPRILEAETAASNNENQGKCLGTKLGALHRRRCRIMASLMFGATDVIAFLISEGHPGHVVVHDGIRHDLGNPRLHSRQR